MAGTLQADFLQPQSNTGLTIVSPTGSAMASINTAGIYSATGTQMFNASGTITSGVDISVNGLTVGKGGGNNTNNTALGYQAVYSNTTGTQNIGIGSQALYATTTSNNNIGVGVQALYTNTTGAQLIGIGSQALYLNTTGADNVAIGWQSLYSNTTGGSNVAIGRESLKSNTTAGDNTAIGYQSLYANSTASYNTAVGYQAGYAQTTGTGQNTFIGTQAGLGTTGYNNTFIGNYSGALMTSGNNNTVIGQFSGNTGGLSITTSSNYVVLSDGSGNPRAYWDGSGIMYQYATVNDWALQVFNQAASGAVNGVVAYFRNQTPNNSSSVFFGGLDSTNYKFKVYSNGGIANYQSNNNNLSDRREKTNFAPAKDYLNTICNIPVQTFNYIDQNMEEDPGTTLGVVAQDVQSVAPELVTETNWGTEENPKIRLAIYQTDLQFALMKSIQELKATVDAQANTISILESRLASANIA